ncbi:uncharacterized protein LOC123320990 [Coccinella septempunctata]|uniref:uncharacterized protein LOC123320990 n=1 Tax=Coccinella septempunctata TaxID=41139 RepID=UPI001D07F538|nr:uncharacterized protein LOC123320990 [Coccinella septempunctata]
MEMEYEKLLAGWGLDFLSESFREEGITDESFDLLDDDTIKVMIPKAGPRLIFKKKFESHVNKKLQKSPETTVRNYKYFEETESTCSTETANSMLIMNPDEELKVLLESFDELEDNLNHSKNSSKRKVSLTGDEPFNKMAKIPSIFYPLVSVGSC